MDPATKMELDSLVEGIQDAEDVASYVAVGEVESLLGDSSTLSKAADYLPGATGAVSDLISRGLKSKSESDAKKEAQADIDAKAKAANVIDRAATVANANAANAAYIAEKTKAAADATIAKAKASTAASAVRASDAQTSRISPEAQIKRVDMAQVDAASATAAYDKATDAFNADPKSAVKEAAMKLAEFRKDAAEATAARVAGGAPSDVPAPSADGGNQNKIAPSPPPAGEPFYAKKLGPLPAYGWGFVAMGLGAAVFTYLKLRRR